jgi:PAS domain S-box-containing protein
MNPKPRDRRSFVTEWLMLGLFLLTLGAYIGVSLFQDYDDLDGLSRERLASLATTIGEELENRLLGANSAMTGIIKDAPYWKAQKHGDEIANRQLITLSEALEGVRTLSIFDAEGTVLASSRKEFVGQNARNRDYFQNVLRKPDPDTLYVGAPFTTTMGVYAINLLRVIPGPEGRFAGAVSVTLETDDFKNLLRAMRYTPDLSLGIVHGAGKPLLFVPEPAGLRQMNLAEPGRFLSRHLDSGQKTSVLLGPSRILGGERMAALRSAQPAGLSMSAPLVVSASRELRTIFAPWRSDIYAQGALYCALSLIATLALYFLQRRRRAYDRLTRRHELSERRIAERLALATKAVGIGVWEYAPQSESLIWDDTMFVVFGKDKAAFSSAYDAWKNSLLPEDLAGAEAVLRACLDDGQGYDTSFRIRRDDGEIRTIWAVATVERDAQGKVQRMLGINQDISKRIEIENALHENEARYRFLADNMADVLWTMDLDARRFTYVSPSVERLRGYSFEEVLAQPMEASLTRRSLEQVQARISQRVSAFLAGDPAAVTQTDELEQSCKDGSSVWTEVTSTYLKNDRGGITVVAVTRDISRRRQAEQALQESHAFNLSVLDSLVEHVAVLDGQGVIVAVNEAWRRFARDNDAAPGTVHSIGLSYFEVCAKAPAQAFGAEAAAASAGIASVLAGQRIEFHLEYPCHSQQEERWFCMHVTPLQGSRPGAVIAHENITARKLAEIDIRRLNNELEKRVQARTAQLQSANTELQQFAYVASHDLQEPLRMVTSYVQLLEKRLADKLDPDTRDFMGFAVDGALRMQKLIQDILAYSRVGTRAQPLAAVDSATALQEALHLLAGQIEETGAEVDAHALPTVLADRTQLTQLFQNLIGNAIKFCPGRAPRVQIEARRETGGSGARWRFTVTDNGIGIAPEYRDRIFIMFQRLHTRREFPGTGIGLAICKRIVERHGGAIGVEPAAGGGSVFWFTLPEEHST